jgi:peptide/nickel transport system permease protein
LVQYLSWLGNAVHGNLGIAAISGLKVTSVVGQQAPVSLELALLGLIIATVVGVPVGLVAGLLNGRRSDLLFRLPFLVVYSMPFFVSGTLLLLAAAHYFPSLYAASYVSMSQSVVGNMRVMALPALAVGLPVAGLLVQMTRATIVEVITQPYMTTARAVGLRPLRLYGLYALKAACLPILSLEGFMYGILIGGVVVVEDVFSLPGLGRGLLQSIQNLEFIQLEAQVMIIAIAFILGNLIVDVVAPIIDKRLLTT